MNNNDTRRLPTIPGYQIQSVIGRGGAATVYLAKQIDLNRSVAIKVARFHHRTPNSESIQRFKREGQCIANLSHPHIINIHDMKPIGRQFFIVMDYLPDGSLADLLVKEKTLTPDHALRILKRILAALSYAHQHGIIHRDLKPANILFRDGKYPILADFGIAKALDEGDQITAFGEILGTVTYMSPEQAEGNFDQRSDLYSIGVVLYEMLTGSAPYQGSFYEIQYKHVHDTTPTLPDSIQRYQPLIDKLLAKNPKKRLQNAEAVITEINKLTSSATTTQDHRKPISHYKAPAVLAVILSIFGIFFWGYTQQIADTPFANTQQAQQAHAEEREPTNDDVSHSNWVTNTRAYNALISILNFEPQQGFVWATEYYTYNARLQADKGAWNKSLALVDKGLAISPADTTLLSMKNDIFAHQRKVQQRQNTRITQLKIENLLAQAHTYRENLTLIGQNADAGNRSALAGVQWIEKYYQDNAEQAYKNGQIQESLQWIHSGLSINPEAFVLHALKQRIAKNKSNAKQKQVKISALLSQAQARIDTLQLTTPAGDNALEYCMAVLSLNPKHQQAKSLLKAIARKYVLLAKQQQSRGKLHASLTYLDRALRVDGSNKTAQTLGQQIRSELQKKAQTQLLVQYEDLAKKAMLAGDYNKSLNFIDNGIAENHNHPPLLTLKKTVLKRIHKKRQKQRRMEAVESLLQEATTVDGAKRHSESSRQKMSGIFRKVLILDSSNAIALNGIERILGDYAELATNAMNNRDFDQSMTLLRHGLALSANHLELQKINREVLQRQHELLRNKRMHQDVYKKPEIEYIPAW